MKRILLLPLIVAALCIAAFGQFSFNDLMKVRRVSDPQLSPDGKQVAFTIGDVNMTANRVVNQIYVADLDRPDRPPRQITSGNSSNSAPRWSPDGKKLAFTTGGQIWTMEPDGDRKRQVTSISTGAGNPVWSPDGRWIAFNSDVYPDCSDDACNKKRDDEAEASKVKAIVTERLLYRHWVEWRDKKRTHVFVAPSEGGKAVDLTPGDFDSPPYAASSGVDYAFSPDSKEIAFLKNPDKIEAISTNSDIVIASITDKNQKNITSKNRGYDASPAYTPDGKYLIYRSQPREGFEADRWRLMRYDRQSGETVELTRGFDQQVEEFTISSDSKSIYFVAGVRGRNRVFTLPVEPDFRLRIATHVKDLTSVSNEYSSSSGLNISSDGKTLIFLSNSMTSPSEVFSADLTSGSSKPVTRANAPLGLSRPEDLDWTGALGAKVHGFLVKPANFDASKKYPLIVLIHGGPQGAWMDNWGYRWNPQIWANAGYVVFMPNPRGSTTYGQKFVDEISGDWGGKVVVDLKNGVAEVIKRPYIDKNRIGAAGASYGGYMVDWLLGHNNDPRFRFKAFLSHAGVYNLESMAGATEELWFVKWEFKGMPWENPVLYNRWSPHKFAANFDTPTLVTAGEIDYRVPVDQSYQLFTGLQLKGVPSKLIVFPDEGHWILKPQNSEFWHKNVFDWFAKYLK
ncbi:MAG: S9 family peptidase [Pyrinomonadaceae bacterium]|nr:S9 family peptidase [Blastocatellia bacterium]MCW5956973.1 S9 family peptidase [Pyrinomonadaceae bacterium]